jgi:hypothetical protein
MHTHTSTYAVLQVSPSAYNHVRERLDAAGVLPLYLDQSGEKRELIVLGPVALVSHPDDAIRLDKFRSGDQPSALVFPEGRVEMRLGEHDGKPVVSVKMEHNATGNKHSFMLTPDALKALVILGDQLQEKIREMGSQHSQAI